MPADITIFADADCEFDDSPAVTGDVTDEADNCTSDLDAKFSTEYEDGACEGEVIITRTWVLTDDCGNSTTKVQTITVEDNTPPTLACVSGKVVPLKPNGKRPLTPEILLDLSPDATFDNCSEVIFTDITPAIVDCDDVGGLTEVVVTAEDDCGNEATCTATIEVSDKTALPKPWEGVDIGNPGSGNEYSYNPCEEEFTIVAGSPLNLYDKHNDNQATISRTLCGLDDNVGIRVKVESISEGGFAGVFVRDGNASNAKYAAVLKYNSESVLVWEHRTSTGGERNWDLEGMAIAPEPFWLEIGRTPTGAVVARYSVTGTPGSWTPWRQLHIALDECITVGMIAYKQSQSGGPITAVFSNVGVAGSTPSSGNLSLATLNNPDGTVQGMDMEAELTAESLNIEVYPNPASSELTVQFGTELPELSAITLRNQLGQAIDKRQLRTPDTHMTWDVSNLAPGTYFLEVRTAEGAPQVVKFLKSR